MNSKAKKCFVVLLLVYIGFIIRLGVSSVDTFVDTPAFREQNQMTISFINLLREKDIEGASLLIDKSAWGTQSEVHLKNLASLLGPEALIKIKAIEAEPFIKTNPRDGVFASRIFYQLQLENDKWLIAKVGHEKINNQWVIRGFYLQQTPLPVQQQGNFTLLEKTPKHYFILIGNILGTLFCIYCFSLCYGSNTNRKILWLLFISVGFGMVGIDWTQGQLRSDILSLQLPPFQIGRITPYAQWLFITSLPIGALIYYFYKYKQEKTDDNGLNNAENSEENIGV